jgi:hypothetical protein
MSGSSVGGAIQPITPYQQPDVIGQAGQIGQLQNLLLGNQQQQQTLAARQAIGQAYSQAIDPKTGQLDSNKLMSLVAGNPNAAYLAGDVAAQAQQRQEEQYKINQAQLSQTANRLGVYKSAFAPLLSDPSPTPDKVYSVIQGLGAAGMPTDEIAGDVSATMPVMDPTKMSDPAYQSQYKQALHSWLTTQWGGNLSGETQASVFRPSVSLVNTGGGIQGVDTNPTTNPGAVGTTLPMTMTPGEAVTPITGTNKDGSTYSIPAATYAQRTGLGGIVFGGDSSGGGSAGPSPGPSIFGTGRLPGRGAPYSGPTAGVAAGGDGNPPGSISTGVGPAQVAGATVAGTGSANDLHSLYANVSTSGPRLYQLNQALTSLQALGTTGTGPGTDVRNSIQSYLQSIPGVGGALSSVIGGDPTKIANYDEANKYLTAYASNQAANLGSGTDAKLATALSANASTHISNLAGVNVVKATIGLERMQQAQAQAFTQSGLPASSFDQWSANWNKTADARAYAFDLMSPQQRGAVLSGMTGATRTQFLNQVWSAAQGGFIDPNKLGLSTGSAGGASAPAAASTPPPSFPPVSSGPPVDPNTGLPVGITP